MECDMEMESEILNLGSRHSVWAVSSRSSLHCCNLSRLIILKSCHDRLLCQHLAPQQLGLMLNHSGTQACSQASPLQADFCLF